jgi:hypothetical protein
VGSSPAPNRPSDLDRRGSNGGAHLLGLGGEQVAEEQGVDVAGQEVGRGLGGAVDDWFAAEVEAGVEDHRDAGVGGEAADEAVVQGVGGGP